MRCRACAAKSETGISLAVELNTPQPAAKDAAADDAAASDVAVSAGDDVDRRLARSYMVGRQEAGCDQA